MLIYLVNYSICKSVICVFLDNALIHTSPFIQTRLGKQVTFILNAPYSPMLNPIEEFFSKFKNLVKKDLVRNAPELLFSIQNAMLAFTLNDFKGYMRHALRNAYDALNDKDL